MCKYCEKEDLLDNYGSEDIFAENVRFLGAHMLLRVAIYFDNDSESRYMGCGVPKLGIYSGIQECYTDFISKEIPIQCCPMCGRKFTNEIES